MKAWGRHLNGVKSSLGGDPVAYLPPPLALSTMTKRDLRNRDANAKRRELEFVQEMISELQSGSGLSSDLAAKSWEQRLANASRYALGSDKGAPAAAPSFAAHLDSSPRLQVFHLISGASPPVS